MATYQILYWRHIPLSVRATDEQGAAGQALAGRFEEALRKDTENYRLVMHSSSFKWGRKQERAGSAVEVAAAVAQELTENWDEAAALASFNRGELDTGT
ncbi:MAG: virulence factor [Chloroflexota bacterium]